MPGRDVCLSLYCLLFKFVVKALHEFKKKLKEKKKKLLQNGINCSYLLEVFQKCALMVKITC